MKIQMRDFDYIARPRLARLFARFRRARPMAIAMTKKIPASA